MNPMTQTMFERPPLADTITLLTLPHPENLLDAAHGALRVYVRPWAGPNRTQPSAYCEWEALLYRDDPNHSDTPRARGSLPIPPSAAASFAERLANNDGAAWDLLLDDIDQSPFVHALIAAEVTRDLVIRPSGHHGPHNG